jgi:hypothetical protein
MKRIFTLSLVAPLCLVLSLFALAKIAIADTQPELPEGFIVLSETRMTWADAKAWCRQHGGKLPRIDNSDSLAFADRRQVSHIDGFGAPGDPWPPGLPVIPYWTGTVRTGTPDRSWFVVVGDGGWSDVGRGGGVALSIGLQSLVNRVVCVP